MSKRRSAPAATRASMRACRSAPSPERSPLGPPTASAHRSPRRWPSSPHLRPSPIAELSPVPGHSAAGAPQLETGTSRTKAYVGARRAVTFSFRLSGAAPSALSVDLVRAADGVAVKTWAPEGVVAGQVSTVSWNGRLGRAGAATGPLLVPADGRRPRRGAGHELADGRRRARRLRPVRPHLPGARPPRLWRLRRRLRLGPVRPLPSGP